MQTVRQTYATLVNETQGEIFYPCRISVMHISAPKRLTVGVNKNIIFLVIKANFMT
jgi:hypothetical protein